MRWKENHQRSGGQSRGARCHCRFELAATKSCSPPATRSRGSCKSVRSRVCGVNAFTISFALAASFRSRLFSRASRRCRRTAWGISILSRKAAGLHGILNAATSRSANRTGSPASPPLSTRWSWRHHQHAAPREAQRIAGADRIHFAIGSVAAVKTIAPNSFTSSAVDQMSWARPCRPSKTSGNRWLDPGRARLPRSAPHSDRRFGGAARRCRPPHFRGRVRASPRGGEPVGRGDDESS